MEKVVLRLLLLADVLVSLGSGQPPSPAQTPWNHHIQWENNGRVFSLLSTGTQYHSPAQPRKRAQLLLTSQNSPGRREAPVALRGATNSPRNHLSRVMGSDAGQHLLASGQLLPTTTARRTVTVGQPSHQPPRNSSAIFQESSGSGALGGGRGALGEPSVSRARPVFSRRTWESHSSSRQVISTPTPPDVQRAVSHTPLSSNAVEIHFPRPRPDRTRTPGTSSPRTQHSTHHRNSVFYNIYSPDLRNRVRGRPSPGAGYGTRFFYNGLPDLVPDPYYIQAASYLQRVQMYALRCAAEENCLSRSAYRPGVSDLDYRVLLRFPQRVKNQGTADFLPMKPRHEWEWHSCHQHFHSMEAFSHYDLLDVSTGLKVAEGHKASFCLEDTSCDAGVQRRYACTAHTQGLGPGCYDTYHANIDCQWIDITDVPPGNYTLKVTVNPSQLVQESDYFNNEVRCDVGYRGSYVQVQNCRLTA
ncbi:lysyl oxidase-like 5a [Neosynchiropus ocellatus]